MSNFSNQANRKDETRKVESGRREALGKYFYDLSKLTFAGLVLGVVIPLTQDIGNLVLYAVLVIGTYFVCLFAYFGNKCYKIKK